MQVSVIVPTYNEKENIESLITQLLALLTGVHIIVVDDNSPDGTGEIADRLAVENAGRVSVIHRLGKLGLGTAYITGLKRRLPKELISSVPWTPIFPTTRATFPISSIKLTRGTISSSARATCGVGGPPRLSTARC